MTAIFAEPKPLPVFCTLGNCPKREDKACCQACPEKGCSDPCRRVKAVGCEWQEGEA